MIFSIVRNNFHLVRYCFVAFFLQKKNELYDFTQKTKSSYCLYLIITLLIDTFYFMVKINFRNRFYLYLFFAIQRLIGEENIKTN